VPGLEASWLDIATIRVSIPEAFIREGSIQGLSIPKPCIRDPSIPEAFIREVFIREATIIAEGSHAT
jgi:hypothetical protein